MVLMFSRRAFWYIKQNIINKICVVVLSQYFKVVDVSWDPPPTPGVVVAAVVVVEANTANMSSSSKGSNALIFCCLATLLMLMVLTTACTYTFNTSISSGCTGWPQFRICLNNQSLTGMLYLVKTRDLSSWCTQWMGKKVRRLEFKFLVTGTVKACSATTFVWRKGNEWAVKIIDKKV